MNDDWLRQLAPAHAPPPAAWWPPAPGWWLLGALLIAAAIGAWLWWRRPRRRVRRSALAELGQIEAAYADPAYAQALERLMRRFAIAAYGRERVAGLAGDAWLAFVAAHGGTALAGAPGAALMRAAYGGKSTDDATQRDAWRAGARGFLRSAR